MLPDNLQPYPSSLFNVQRSSVATNEQIDLAQESGILMLVVLPAPVGTILELISAEP
jgi:hypothetical protein